MKNMKGQTAALMGVIILVVSGIVGLAILNDVVTDTANPLAGSQNSLNISPTGTLTTIGNGLVADSQVIINASNGAALTEGTDYTIVDATGIITNVAVTGDTTVNVTSYAYTDATNYESALARTIATYIVPIGLLSMLGFVALFARRS